MIRSIIRLNVTPGLEREFEESFRLRRVLEHAREVAHLRTGELLRPLAGGPYVVVATWDSAADYQRWVDSPVRAELASVPLRHRPQFEGAGPAELFEIIDQLTSPS